MTIRGTMMIDYYSDSHSDNSPILSYRHDKYRRYVYLNENKAEERNRRSAFTILAKFLLFCITMILLCALMHIPIYNKAYCLITKGIAGWPVDKNRDIKIYVLPNKVTTIHEPNNVCPKPNENKNKLFILIIICSSAENFENRNTVRETWGNYKSYVKASKIFSHIRDKYKNYNFTYDLYPIKADLKYIIAANATKHYKNVTNSKRGTSKFGLLLPELNNALQKDLVAAENKTVPKFKFVDDSVLPVSDHMDETICNISVMKIATKANQVRANTDGVLPLLKKPKSFKENAEYDVDTDNTERDFKLVFLLGLPGNTTVQNKIVEESKKYGDIIQEGFIDSYNNLTLKSIMMLKWVKNNCGNSVRYILKTDDDMYINVPYLILSLRNRSRVFDEKVKKGSKEKEYMLIGDLIHGSTPIVDRKNKWYSPRYMFSGRVYPRYVSGTGYALSAAAARALYAAALRTPYFHLEDIYITGLCTHRSVPRISPSYDPLFWNYKVSSDTEALYCAHTRVTVHNVPPPRMWYVHARLLRCSHVDRLERERLTVVRIERMQTGPTIPLAVKT